MNPIASILDLYPALVIDGALATELERRGCDLSDELWSAKILLEQPELIRQVHLDYFKAGQTAPSLPVIKPRLRGSLNAG